MLVLNVQDISFFEQLCPGSLIVGHATADI